MYNNRKIDYVCWIYFRSSSDLYLFCLYLVWWNFECGFNYVISVDKIGVVVYVSYKFYWY